VFQGLTQTGAIWSNIGDTGFSLMAHRGFLGIATLAFITTTLMGGITHKQARLQQETLTVDGTPTCFQSRQAEGIASLYGFATQVETQEQHI